MIMPRSSSLNWLNWEPRRTRSWFCSTNRSTELCKKPTRLRPSITNRRLTSPWLRQREMVFVETLNSLASSFNGQYLFAGGIGRYVGGVGNVLDE